MHIAATYVALHTLLLMTLAMLVLRQRWRSSVDIGDGGDPGLFRAIRVHANAVEQAAPTFAILILFALLGAPAWALHAFGATTLAGRLAHAWGLAGGTPRMIWRQIGMGLTWTGLGLGALGLLVG
ncbi:MAPEG family protein [Humitalea sp. 24SJ18S-53]|uniref:MAPEG family protein n=1 Tax=Humitalea sp. 24SJ18S-53 TaxID=3422307 RepID=UPI003D66F205